MSVEFSPLNYRYQALPDAPEEVQEVAGQDRYSPAGGSLAERTPLNRRQVNYGGTTEASPPRIADKTLSKICNITNYNGLLRRISFWYVKDINDIHRSHLSKMMFAVRSFFLLLGRCGDGLLIGRILCFIAGCVASIVTRKSKF